MKNTILSMSESHDGHDTQEIPTRNRSRNRRLWFGVLLAGVLIIITVSMIMGAGPALTAFFGPEWSNYSNLISQPPCGEWTTTVGPRLFTGNIMSVSASSSKDVWAVGFRYKPLGNAENSAFTMHWNGTTWSEKDVFQSGTGDNITLLDVKVVSFDNAWAVGWMASSGAAEQATILHWEGDKWNTVPIPQVGFYSSRLRAVNATSANDVWAVGSYKGLQSGGSVNPERTLILHWDGHQITLVRSPNPSRQQDAGLSGVSSLSATDIWAVGTQDVSLSGKDEQQTLTMHWDGNLWNIVPSPNNGPYYNGLEDIVSISQTDAWAVGTADKPLVQQVGSVQEPIIMHWDGHDWRLASVAGVVALTNYSLVGISALSSSDIWAVGGQATRGEATQFVLHWDGKAWSIIDGPTRLADQSFRSVTTLEDGTVWAVGDIHREDQPALGMASQFRTGPCSSPTTLTGSPAK